MKPPDPQVTAMPVADVTAPPYTPELLVQQAYPVRQPEEEHSEFMIQVRASIIARARKRTQKLAQPSFPWPEFLLGISTAVLGAALGALPASVDIRSWMGITYFVAFPAIGLSCMVAYMMLRRNSIVDVTRTATEILDELPDPEKTR